MTNLQSNKPTVSIIIPTYNRSWGLIRAVNSVLCQSVQDFELLIVDDCSPDDTPEVVQSLNDPRIRYFRQPENVGVAENWGTGLQLAQGEFITFLMDDDSYKSNFLANRLPHLQSDPNLAVVFSSYEMQNLENNQITTISANLADRTELNSKGLLKSILARQWFIGASMYRKKAVESVWELAKQDHLIVDFSLAIYLALKSAGNGLYLNTPDFTMSIHPGQNSQAKLKEVLTQTDNTLSRILTESIDSQFSRLIRREKSSWKVQQARYLDLKTHSNIGAAYQLIVDAIRIDLSNVWAWSQLSKLMILGRL